MKRSIKCCVMALTLCALAHGANASDKVVIGDIDDMSGPYADIIGAGGIEAAKMAMYIMQVKKPSESKGPWDYYRLVETMSGEEAFGKLSQSECPLVKNLIVANPK